MSISTILSTAQSGLMAAQTGIRTVSDNVSNANTPGYVRKVVNQTSLVTQGVGGGVHVEGIGRVIDRYLQAASLTSTSMAGRSSVLAEMLDRSQGLFGDPGGTTSYFNKLDEALTAFSALADDPSSSLQRSQSISSMRSFFEDGSRIASSVVSMQREADTRIQSNIGRVNDLLAQVATLNADVRRAKITGADSSGAENIQSQLVDEISGLINVQIQESTTGGLVLRTQDGMLLADETAGRISFNSSAGAAAFLTVTPANSGGQSFDAAFSSGELVGLLESRNREMPAILAQLAEFNAGVARELNRAHNASSSVPPAATLTGRNTALDLPTALNGFSGETTIALLDSGGVLQNRIDVDFDGGTMSLNGGAGVAFTPATFLAQLNGLLGANGTASFTNGALSLAATTGGVAIQDDATNPSTKAGLGFSQFFGLNDLIRSSTYPTDTGLASTDPHGFTAGQTITLRLSNASGARLRDVEIAVPAGTTMADLRTTLNANVTPYGQFDLSATGRLSFSSLTSPAASVSVVEDTTARGVGGPSISAFFGLGVSQLAAAASGYSVQPSIYQNPSRMATARLDLTVTPPSPSLAAGDGRGAAALAGIGEAMSPFGAAGGLPGATMSISRYASEFAGALGRGAATAENARAAAESVKTEAVNRRSSYEGVNMDEELIRLTTYQQAFNASARLIQAANDLYDTLLSIV